MRPRPYQADALRAVCRELTTNRSTLLVMATGLGKTVVFSQLVAMAKLGKVMVVAHREELVTQAANKIELITGTYPEIEMAESKASTSLLSSGDIVVASVQTLTAGRRMEKFDPSRFSLLIFDECHHIKASTWMRVLKHFTQNENLKVLGVTATPKRTDKSALGEAFDTVAYDYSLVKAIPDGWCVPLEQMVVEVEDLDYDQVRTTAGDLNAKDLAKLMEQEYALHAIASPTLELAADRRTLVFAASVEAGRRLTEILNRDRPRARFVSGKTPKLERKESLDAFAAGEFDILVNVGVLTEGFDDPGIEAIVLARPTKSQSLWMQMIGRGTRPLPGVVDDAADSPDARRAAIAASSKPNVLILDFAGNATRHNLIQAVDILGGDYSEETRERAKQLARGRGQVKPEELLEEAEDQLAEEREQARLEAIAKRAKLKARTKYRTKTIDVFGVLPQLEQEMSIGFQEQPSDKQLDMLSRNGIDGSQLSKRQAQAAIKNIIARRQRGLCTLKQMDLLGRYGIDGSQLTKEQATKQIDTIAANGWKVPSSSTGSTTRSSGLDSSAVPPPSPSTPMPDLYGSSSTTDSTSRRH